ncbi:hypothetical protein D3C86_1616390 [compost metagenome]
MPETKKIGKSVTITAIDCLLNLQAKKVAQTIDTFKTSQIIIFSFFGLEKSQKETLKKAIKKTTKCLTILKFKKGMYLK